MGGHSKSWSEFPLHDGTLVPFLSGRSGSASASSEPFGGSKCLLLPGGLPGGHHLPLLVEQHGLHGVPELEGPLLHDELALAGLVFLPSVRAPDGDDFASLHLDSPVELVAGHQTWEWVVKEPAWILTKKVTFAGRFQREATQ